MPDISKVEPSLENKCIGSVHTVLDLTYNRYKWQPTDPTDL